MEPIINIFVVTPKNFKLIDTFYRNVHKFRENGYPILIHDTTPLIEIIKSASRDFRFRVLVHLEFQGKKLQDLNNAPGMSEMKELKDAFKNGEFVFFTREPEIFPNKGTVEYEFVEWEGHKIYNGGQMTLKHFFDTIPVNVAGDINDEAKIPMSISKLSPVIEHSTHEQENKESIDVAILCIIQKEFDALDKLFDFKKETPCDSVNGLRIWKKKITQTNGANELTVIFAMIGNAGNLPSYLETDALLKKYSIGLMILCGIAAGNKNEEMTIYSVAIADMIIYYENQKLKPNKEKRYRLNPIPLDGVRSKDIRYIEDKEADWKMTFKESLKSIKIVKDDLKNKDWIDPHWFDKVVIKSGNIFSGEKLFADDETLKGLADMTPIRKSSVAGEMEGYGFGYACTQNHHKDWLVFRGISDYGGSEKSDPINDKYQIIAALAAASLVKYYLLNIYMP